MQHTHFGVVNLTHSVYIRLHHPLMKANHMTTNDATRATAEALPETPKLSEARDILTRLKDLNELMFMAGEGMFGFSRNAASAITAGCDEIGAKLREACDIIDAHIIKGREGGAA